MQLAAAEARSSGDLCRKHWCRAWAQACLRGSHSSGGMSVYRGTCVQWGAVPAHHTRGLRIHPDRTGTRTHAPQGGVAATSSSDHGYVRATVRTTAARGSTVRNAPGASSATPEHTDGPWTGRPPAARAGCAHMMGMSASAAAAAGSRGTRTVSTPLATRAVMPEVAAASGGLGAGNSEGADGSVRGPSICDSRRVA